MEDLLSMGPTLSTLTSTVIRNCRLSKKIKISCQAYDKNACGDVLGFMITNFFLSLLKKQAKVSKILEFSGNPKFFEDVVFHHKMFGFSNFGLDLSVCFVDTMI